MKQLVVNGKGEVLLLDVPAPSCQPGEVLIQTSKSIISAGTDSTLISNSGGGSLIGKITNNPQLINRFKQVISAEGGRQAISGARDKIAQLNALGYSIAGTVVECRAENDFFIKGERVAAVGQQWANHAEFISVPERYVFKIPEGVTDEDASFAALASIALHGLRQGGLELGETVCVIGLGLIGQILVKISCAFGMSVIGIDPNPVMREIAKKSGAEIALHPDDPLVVDSVKETTSGIGVDGVIVTVGGKQKHPIKLAISIAAERSKIVMLGHSPISVDSNDFYKKELTIVSSRGYGPGRYDPEYEVGGKDYPVGYVRWTVERNIDLILKMLRKSKMGLRDIISHTCDLSEGVAAYEKILREPNRVAVSISFCDETVKSASTWKFSKVSKFKKDGAIGVGFVGTGNFSRATLLPILARNRSFDLVALASNDGLRAEFCSKKFSIPMITTEVDTLINNDEVDLVCVANRHSQHADLVVKALKAKKDVFVEKPLAINEQQLQKIQRAAAESSGLVFVGLNRCFSNLGKVFKSEIKKASGSVQFLYRINSQANKGWFSEANEGGAFIGEFSHFFDFINWAIGGKKVNSIDAFPANAELPKENLSVVIRFDGGHSCTFIFTTSGTASYSKELIEAFFDGKVIQLVDFKTLTSTGQGNEINISSKKSDKGYDSEFQALADIIKGQKNIDFPDIKRGSEALMTSLAALSSMKVK